MPVVVMNQSLFVLILLSALSMYCDSVFQFVIGLSDLVVFSMYFLMPSTCRGHRALALNLTSDSLIFSVC